MSSAATERSTSPRVDDIHSLTPTRTGRLFATNSRDRPVADVIRTRAPHAVLVAAACLAAFVAAGDDDLEAARQRMLEDVEAEVHATREYLGFDSLDPRVSAALAEVPRH